MKLSTILIITVLAAVLTVSAEQFGIGEGQVTPPSKGRVSRPITVTQHLDCSAFAYISTCKLLRDLVALNLPAVDAALAAEGWGVENEAGQVIFPRP